MFGIPYEKITFQSSLKPSEIASRLETATSRSFWYKWPPKDKDFVGTILIHGFRIYRNIRSRNTYLPFLVGKINENGKGSQVVVTMTLHPIAIVIMAGFFLFALRVFFIPGGEVGVKLLIFSMPMSFHIAMCLVGFNPEVLRAKGLLREILEIK